MDVVVDGWNWALKEMLDDSGMSARLRGSAIASCGWFLLLPTSVLVNLIVFPYYRNVMDNADKIRWDLRIVRSIAAFYGVYYGLRLWFDPAMLPFFNDVTHYKTWETIVFMRVVCGFFVFETVMYYVVLFWHGKGDNTLLIHHILGLAGYYAFLLDGTGHFFGILLFTEEFSAPWTGISWLLAKMNLSHTYKFLINQWIMWVVFRMCVDYIMLYYYLTRWRETLMVINPIASFTLLLGTTTLAVYLNPIWFKAKLQNALNWKNTPDKSFRAKE